MKPRARSAIAPSPAIEATHIRRSGGLLRRSVAIEDIVQLKLLRLRGLEWIMTPRLVVRTRGSFSCSCHCADAGLLKAFEQLAYGRAPSLTSAR
jgi:hypothetical protein